VFSGGRDAPQGDRPTSLRRRFTSRGVSSQFKLSSTPGDWLDCWFDEHEKLDRCKMTDEKGKVEFEDVFLLYERESPLLQGKLVFDTRRTGNLWTGSIPIIYLTDGEVLLPRSQYEKAKQTVDWSNGKRGSP